jgi:hypothetical protein
LRGKLQYKLAFVGYGPHRNRWTSVEDAAGCPDAIAAYWQRVERGVGRRAIATKGVPLTESSTFRCWFLASRAFRSCWQRVFLCAPRERTVGRTWTVSRRRTSRPAPGGRIPGPDKFVGSDLARAARPRETQ